MNNLYVTYYNGLGLLVYLEVKSKRTCNTLHIFSQISVICFKVKTGLSPVPISALILLLLVEGTFEELHWMLELPCKPFEGVLCDIWLEELSNSLEVITEALGTCKVDADLGDIFPSS